MDTEGAVVKTGRGAVSIQERAPARTWLNAQQAADHLAFRTVMAFRAFVFRYKVPTHFRGGVKVWLREELDAFVMAHRRKPRKRPPGAGRKKKSNGGAEKN